ncbi:PREDICTED: uncharacterized protein LOC105960281 [Erythranthe guttata]|uniref:uncharacterized protein LOC105960281 n=1 Tax=Erythranthe guttata TaxID=4155 RepID=UPI00064D891D|nr:PREDICTED: uncharacterized protein LOC105960281 [Erythranthe guttata]|eukprot:XP_012839901.1 PREDICTED: uncharacterized protein LOC105960281 [Erythranthe guttata]
MADGTRFAELRKDMDMMREQMQAISEANANSVEENRAMMTLMMAKLQQQAAPHDNGGRPPDLGNQEGPQWGTEYQLPTKCSSVEFPKFDGTNLRRWVYKCDQFFDVDGTPSSSKVKLAAVHLEERVLQWHQTFMNAHLTREIPSWEEYIRALNSRFGTLFFKDPMSELMNLKQTGSLQGYLDRFDELMNCVDLSEPYAVSCFLGGLKPEISLHIKMFKPKNMMEVVSLAKLQEQTITLSPRKHPSQHHNPTHNPIQNPIRASYTTNRPNTLTISRNPNQNSNTYTANNYPSPQSNRNSSTFHRNQTQSFNQNKRLSNQEVDDRISKGLCFWCDEKYSRDHNCTKKRQMYVMEIPEDETMMESEVEYSPSVVTEERIEEGEEQLSQVSMHAMTGTHDFRNMRLTGSAKGKTIHILIDNGSTHNFVDEQTAKSLGCELVEMKPSSVNVPGGNMLITRFKCPNFTWKMRGVEFSAEAMTLPLGSCDLVLGIQWLVALGDICSNYLQLKMEFNHMGRNVVLRGLQPNSVKLVSNKKLNKILQKPSQIAYQCIGSLQDGAAMSVDTAHLTTDQVERAPECIASLNAMECVEREGLQVLPSDYADLFVEPKGLPPHRDHDHKIHLKEGSEVVNVRPYRYPAVQKNEIEAIVQELLNA